MAHANDLLTQYIDGKEINGQVKGDPGTKKAVYNYQGIDGGLRYLSDCVRTDRTLS